MGVPGEQFGRADHISRQAGDIDMNQSVDSAALDGRAKDTPLSDAPSNAYRWGQLVMGIVCMAMIANLQYGWTLFVAPMEAKNHWGLTAIQFAFSIFVVVETWLVPVEGWLVDRFGPRPVIAAGAILAGLAWVMNSYATTVTELYVAAAVA